MHSVLTFLLGAQGIEVEVTHDRKDIYDIYVVKPQTIEWELKDIDGRKTWVPYQYNQFKKVYLDKKTLISFGSQLTLKSETQEEV